VANRREEERERLRQAREERESTRSKSEKRRLFIAYAVAGVIGLAVVAGIVLAVSGGTSGGGEAHLNVGSGKTNGFEPDEREAGDIPDAKETNLAKAAQKAGCVVRLELEDEGKSHLPPTATPPDYGTSPPTSGNHAEAPYQQADGAYSEMPDELFIVHSLEHGRPLRGRAAGTEGPLRDDVRGDAALPERQHDLRGRGDHLDQPARLPRVQRRRDARRDPRLRQENLGPVRRRGNRRRQRPDAGRTGPVELSA
jgi:Protein of unknown function (DUF3105)